MSVGLEVAGTWSRSDDPLESIENYFRSAHASLLRSASIGEESGVRSLFATFHPAAESLRVWTERGDLHVSAQTSSVGPGYHYFVCDLLREIGREFNVTWQPPDDEIFDETGYFESGDRSGVERAMLRWVQFLCEVMLTRYGDGHDLMIAMPIGAAFRPGEFLVTHLGPRSREWATAVKEDPIQGKGFFPWWNAAQDGAFYLNRALCLMWSDVRWRAPIAEPEEALLREIASDLDRAYSLDTSLDFPWTEWHEILHWLGKAKEIPETPQAHKSRIGYRRNPVRASLPGGWTIEIPGSLAEEVDEEGTWSAWDGKTTVWVSAYSFSNNLSKAEILQGFNPPGDDVFEYDEGGIHIKGAHTRIEEEGRELESLQARAAVDGALVAVTICYEEVSQREAALIILRSLRK